MGGWRLLYMWTTNALKNGWPMTLKYTEANAFNSSESNNALSIWEGGQQAATMMCSASIQSIGLAIF